MIVIISNKRRLYTYAVFIIIGAISAVGLQSFNKRSIAANAGGEKTYLAIVIDDFGNNSKGTDEMLSLPIKFTGAVMPSMPYTAEDSEKLHNAGKDIILHMPMEAHTGKQSWLGPTHILADYAPEKAVQTFNACIAQIKYCSGFNNHMGSKVSESDVIMDAMLGSIKDSGLIYVDSVTTPKSIGKKYAQKYNITYFSRDVFLDSTQDTAQIKRNLQKAAEISKKKGYAVAIGHVGAEGGTATYNAIKQLYSDFEKAGIEFVSISELRELVE